MISRTEQDRFAQEISGRLSSAQHALYERALAAGMRPHDAVDAALGNRRLAIEEAERRADVDGQARAAAEQLPEGSRAIYESMGGDGNSVAALRRTLGREPSASTPLTEAIDRHLLTPVDDMGREDLVESFKNRGYSQEQAERLARGRGRQPNPTSLLQETAPPAPTTSPSARTTKLVVSPETARRFRLAAGSGWLQLAEGLEREGMSSAAALEEAEQRVLERARADGLLKAGEYTEVVVQQEGK